KLDEQARQIAALVATVQQHQETIAKMCKEREEDKAQIAALQRKGKRDRTPGTPAETKRQAPIARSATSSSAAPSSLSSPQVSAGSRSAVLVLPKSTHQTTKAGGDK